MSDRPAIETVAADWCARREFGLDPTEAAQLVDWLNADPRHARIFSQFEQTSRALDRLPSERPGQMPAGQQTGAVSFLRRHAWVAGLAAAVALAATTTWYVTRPSPDFILSAQTESGGYRVLDLPDGSLVRLNADTRAEVHYTAGERRIRLLSGEALFTVAKNPDRPFYVEAAGVSVRAVGTAFNVRMQPDSVEVMVTEGKVRVDNAASGVSLLPANTTHDILPAGHRVLVQLAPAQPPPIVAAIETVPEPEQVRQLAWHEKRLEFDAVPLSQVVEEFNRYHTKPLVIADPELAKTEFGGTFRADGTETLLALLESNFNVIVERRADETILRRAR